MRKTRPHLHLIKIEIDNLEEIAILVNVLHRKGISNIEDFEIESYLKSVERLLDQAIENLSSSLAILKEQFNDD